MALLDIFWGSFFPHAHEIGCTGVTVERACSALFGIRTQQLTQYKTLGWVTIVQCGIYIRVLGFFAGTVHLCKNTKQKTKNKKMKTDIISCDNPGMFEYIVFF